MSIWIEEVTEENREKWDAAVDQSPQTTCFHQYDALRSLERYFDAELHPLLGYVGQEPVGIFPVFEQVKGPFLLATSPPLSVEIHAGPALLNFQKLKQRKAEKRHREFINRCVDWIDSELEPDHIEIKVTDRYTDVRPFIRRGFDVTPSYTYVLDLSPELDDLQKRFSSDARKNVRNTSEDAYTIREGGVEEIEALVSLVQRRFDELGEYHYLDSSLVTDLYAESDSVRVRPYTCRIDGKIVSGIIALEHGDTVYRWQGGAKPDTEIPATDLLDWRVIRDAKRRDKKRYDLVGAMIPRLCDYKSKFGPEPASVYIVRKSTVPMKVAETVYRRMPNEVRSVVGI